MRRMGKDGRGLRGLCKVNRHELTEVLRRDNRREYTLDTDAALIEAEKAEAQWSYHKEKGYQPLLGFLFELGLALGMNSGMATCQRGQERWNFWISVYQ